MSEKHQKFSDFCTVHGVKHIFNLDHHKIVRVFWIFAVLLTFCGFFFYLQNSWIKLMHEPEVLMKSRERKAIDFPFPAITICPMIFARHEVFNFSKMKVLSSNFTDDECKVMYSNLLWLNPRFIRPRIWKKYEKVCPKEKLLNLNIVETIVNSSVTSSELFDDLAPKLQRTGFSGFGACYTFNGLSFSELFNTENIHDDFKQFQKFIHDWDDVATSVEDNSSWSPERGINYAEDSRMTYLDSNNFDFKLLLSPSNTKNLGSTRHFKMFVHKPNEIVTELNHDFWMNYNEVRI